MDTTAPTTRRVVISQNITLDGSVEMLDEWFDPQESNEAELEALFEQSERCEYLLLGRQTFEDFRGYWPEVEDDATGISSDLDEQEKLVVSSTLTDPAWQRSRILSTDWIEEVRRLAAEPGQDIVVTGSIRVCHALIAAGLVDEYRLYVVPYVQGRGRRLFPDGTTIPDLDLVESRSFSNGHTLLVYKSGNN